MEFEVLGWPADGPTLSLDHERFSYAGKFVMSSTGKAVLLTDAAAAARDGPSASTSEEDDAPKLTDDRRDDDSDAVLAAVAFNEDRTDPSTLWLRYVSVRADRRGDGLGPQLLGRTVERAIDRGYERVRIAVNNPFAYEAAWKAGFGYTGEQTGIAELVMEHPRPAALARHAAEDSVGQYQDGLAEYRERDGLADAERDFLAARLDAAPPDTIDLDDS
ncbi:Acetyltransferase (GNAT) family protein [Natronoarchaeum philippinense]|uniref:Acetyltransferase (GNAT) family protein n=1 Tax=Natronoarchaeum philippinense TaxID=558529 RepID=A0A285N3Q5_NATPI|nr:GNAT family N-acetyltransferase [Natronoarchaeum philippinense]SNZ03457.1 Acetyltransferase (GNAT) family protein [Natronoarchaeum philippinense]